MRRKINIILIILFVVQGVFSFSVGGSVYDISALKYLKYAILTFFIVINVDRCSIFKLPVIFSIILLYTYFYYISRDNATLNIQTFSVRFMNLLSPLFLILTSREFLTRRDINKVVNIVTFSSCIFCFVEYFLLKGVFVDFNFTENGGYYRCISFFIGPNNAATIFFYLFIYYFHSLGKGVNKTKILCVILLLCSIALTGSKTPLLLLLGYVFSFSFFYIVKYKKIKSSFFRVFSFTVLMLGLVWGVYIFLVTHGVYSPREFHSLESDGRFSQILNFYDLVKMNPFFPSYNIFPSPTYDNLYIQIWSDFGLIGLLVFIFGIVWTLLYYYSKISISYAAFFVSWFLLGFTLNSLYAWPLSYIFYTILLRKISYAN